MKLKKLPVIVLFVVASLVGPVGHAETVADIAAAAAGSGARISGPTLLEPLPEHTESVAHGVNDRGQVVGYSGVFDGSTFPPVVEFDAVIWDRKRQPTALADLPGPGGPFPSAEAVDINNRGEVVGWNDIRFESDGSFTLIGRSIKWDRKGEPMLLPPLPGDTKTRPSAINDRGEAVGWSYEPGPRTPVIWDASGNPTALALVPGATAGGALDINNQGVICGTNSAGDISSLRVVVWDHKGIPTSLDPLAEDSFSDSCSINNRGEVAGVSVSLPEFTATPVTWTAAGRPEALDLLPGHDGGAAVGINDRGLAVGASFLSGPEGEFSGVVWDAKGKVSSLPLLDPAGEGSVFGSPRAINSSGKIAGVFSDSSPPRLFVGAVWHVQTGNASDSGLSRAERREQRRQERRLLRRARRQQ